jgi:RNase P/RNase MRP subunit POP5
MFFEVIFFFETFVHKLRKKTDYIAFEFISHCKFSFSVNNILISLIFLELD